MESDDRLGDRIGLARRLWIRERLRPLDPRAPLALAAKRACRSRTDMVKAMCFPGSAEERESLSDTARVLAECHKRHLPVLLETIPVDFDAVEHHTTGNVADAARIGAELGADVLKTHFTGDDFAEVLRAVPVPVVVLGGPTRGDDRGVLADVEAAMRAGASGVAIGRNLWDHRSPAKMIAAMGALVHGGASVDEALRELS